MIRYAGAVKGRHRHPYIYIIIKSYCLYIGETQQHPVSRWGQHMSTVGTFLKRLKEEDEEVWACDKEILFLCVDCEEIATLPYEEHKLVTQYVEHKVHEQCILNLPDLAPIEKIISDTTKTAPARCRHSWGDVIASQVYEEIVLQLSRGGHL
jgi:hypothetical protein